MRDLVITQNITLDGVVDATEGWFMPADGDDVDRSAEEAVLAEQAAASDGFLVGRRTFEDMRSFWPQQTDDETGVTDHLNAVSKHVVSRTLTDPGWAGTTVHSGDLVEEVIALKARPGSDIVVTGSIELCHALLRAGLVDELRLFTYPLVLGAGRRLYPDGTTLRPMRLVEARGFPSGTVLTRHRTA